MTTSTNRSYTKSFNDSLLNHIMNELTEGIKDCNETLETNEETLNSKWNRTSGEYDTLLSGTTSQSTIVLCSCLFFIIGLVGVSGNLLVIVAVLCSKKMRTSMTNLLITNLAAADLVIMLFGIPEIVLFMQNTGWTLNVITCKVNRYILVSALYGSILTLLALSVERYIAIIHPIKAHIFCNKRRLVFVLGCIWPASWIAGLPTLLFNVVKEGHPDVRLRYCMIQFPGNHGAAYVIFKYTESVLFYFLPIVLQVTLYSIIAKHLFMGTDRLYRRVHIRDVNGASIERFSEALQARRGVVKMLILSVLVYFLSYSPNQVLLILNTISPKTFHENWSYLVFTMVVAYINSAANPVMYSIFSQNFRQCFKQVICGCFVRKENEKDDDDKHRNVSRQQSNGLTHSPKLWRHISSTTASTNF